MKMDPPPHPGQTIKEGLKEFNMTQSDLSRIIGTTRQYISLIITKRKRVSIKIALGVEQAFGIKAELLLKQQIDYDLARARLKQVKKEAIHEQRD